VPRRPPPGSAEDWLARSKGNLAMARQPKPADAFWEDQCFQAQQAVEKALKAVYQKKGLLFKFVHDIDELGRGLEQAGLRVPPVVHRAVILTRYAFEARYPGPYEPATEKEFLEALALSAAFVAWAEKIIRTPDKPTGPLLRESSAPYRVSKPKAKPRKRK
jgi:HEPN domain-containing protein